jgi:hypothetical protein
VVYRRSVFICYTYIFIKCVLQYIFTGAMPLCGCWSPPRFCNNMFFLGGTISLTTIPNLEDQRLHFIRPLLFELCSLYDPTINLCSCQHCSPGQWVCAKPPVHKMAVVTKKVLQYTTTKDRVILSSTSSLDVDINSYIQILSYTFSVTQTASVV